MPAETDVRLARYVPGPVLDWLATDAATTRRVVEGTLVFSDVSGFTPLSERLARNGKVGAEQLTEILNAIFGRLLDAAESYGGALLKFGGDALFLLFTGDGHAARGCAAARVMQAELRALGRIDTGSGVVTLGMSVGLHSGSIPLFLVGGSHRELVVCGPEAGECLAMETAANKGEVLLSAQTASLVPADWLGAERDGGRLLRLLRRVEAEKVGTPERPSSAAAEGVPTGLRDFLATVTEPGEHRQAVVSFVQFTGVKQLLHDEGLDATAAAVDALVRAAQDAADQRGVTFLTVDVDKDGGKLILIAGFPNASADDEDRLLHTVRAVCALDSPLQVRAGVNAGHAFAVDVGNERSRAYSVLGDVVNLAARVMGQAPDRRVIATLPVLERVRTDFDTERLDPFMVKGKSHPIDAVLVGEPRGQRRAGATRSTLPLVGRDAEAAALENGLASARHGSGRAVVLVGEPGLGKSRLIENLREQAIDVAQIVVEGGQYGAFTPYFALRWPLRRLLGVGEVTNDEETAERLREVVAEANPELMPWLPLIALPLGLELPATPEVARLSDEFRRARLHAAVGALLDVLIATPTLVVVEDAHWFDDASSDLLRALIEGIVARPWLIAMTRRDEPTGLILAASERVDVLRLTPLDATAAAALASAASDEDPLPDDVLRACAERSGGNPLFLQELIAAARAGNDVDALPANVEAVIASRIDTLAPPDRQLLRQASVLGARFGVGLLSGMLEEQPESLTHRLGGALDGFLSVDDGGQVRFRHALLRSVAYETLPFRQRRALHDKAGQIIEASIRPGVELPLALLSVHFYEAQHYDKAWDYSRQAAEAARRSAGHLDAIPLYERAIDAAKRLGTVPPDDLARMWEAYGESGDKAGRYDIASKGFEQARRLVAGRTVATADLMLKEGWLREKTSSYADAMRWWRRALKLLSSDHSLAARGLRARLQVGLGAARNRQGRFVDAIEPLRRAIEEARSVGDLPALAHGYYLLGWAYSDLGHPDRATYYPAALALYEQLADFTGQAKTLNNMGVTAYYEGRWDEAVDLWERSRGAFHTAGDLGEMALSANNIAEIRSDQGHLEQAEELFREALRVWRGAGFAIGAALATSNLGRVATRDGRLTEAADRFEDAREQFTRIGSARYVAETDLREAERLLFAVVPDLALAMTERTLDTVTSKLGGVPVLLSAGHRQAAYAYLQLGEPESAWDRLRESARCATAADARFELALTLEAQSRAWATYGGGDPAEPAAEAKEILTGLGVVRTPIVPLPLADPDDEPLEPPEFDS